MANLTEQLTKLRETYHKELDYAKATYETSPARLGDESLSSVRENLIARQVNNEERYSTKTIRLDSVREGYDLTGASTPISITVPGDLGVWKIFANQVVAAVGVNTIAPDLVDVVSMQSRTGTWNYMVYNFGTTKGGITEGEEFSSYAGVVNLPEGYTGALVPFTVTLSEAISEYTLDFGPVTKVEKVIVDHETLVEGTDYTVDGQVISFTSEVAAGSVLSVAYFYDNENYTLANKPATISGELREIVLHAEFHEIDVSWTLYTEYIGQRERDIDVAADLVLQAANVVALEQDTAVIKTLADAALSGDNYIKAAEFNKTLPVGVEATAHYNTIATKIGELNKELYRRWKVNRPTCLVCGIDWMTILPILPGFTAGKGVAGAGSYLAGTYNGMKVYISSAVDDYSFFEVIKDGKTVSAILGKFMDLTAGLVHSKRGVQTEAFFCAYVVQLINAGLLVGSSVIVDTTDISTQSIRVVTAAESSESNPD